MRSIKVAHIADSHFDSSENGRLEECVRLHDWIADDMAERDVDLIVHAGDVYERASSPDERNAAVGCLQRCANIAPLIIVRGNHDAHRDLEVLRQIKARFMIDVEERAGCVIVPGPDDIRIHVACLAWPNKAQILADLPPCSPEASSAVAADAIRDVLRGFAGMFEQESQDGPRILLTHAMVRAAKASTGQPLVGCDMEIGLEDLAMAQADYVALGHIHKGQAWELGPHNPDSSPVPVVYPGSTRRTTYGEAEPKGYALVEFHHHDGELTEPGARRWGPCDWQFIEAPAQRMILIEDEWGSIMVMDSRRDPVAVREQREANAILDTANDLVEMTGDMWLVGDMFGVDGMHVDEQIRGADIRLRYRVGNDKREAAAAAAAKWRDQLIEDGAERVKVEEKVIPTKRARAPEVAAASTTADKLIAMWDHRGDVPEERRPRLLDKIARLDEARQ